MKLIVCLDDNNGMAFNKRRQSRDRAVYLKIADFVDGGKLWLRPVSQSLFEELPVSAVAVDDPSAYAAEEDYCFLEDVDVTKYLEKANQLYLFRWNRKYPSDLKFPVKLPDGRFNLVESMEFEGNSHPLITLEVYSDAD